MSIEARPATVRYRGFTDDSARWEGFVFRSDDIVISTPPKCGTTWCQMICALLVLQTPDLPDRLDKLSPWLDMLTRPRDEVVADLEAQTHRRFIKTHAPADGLPYDPRVTYVVVGRDPRDVALSWDNHRANTNLDELFALREATEGLDDLAELFPDGPPQYAETVEGRFWGWVDSDAPATASVSMLGGTEHHIATWFELIDAGADNVVLLHYDDLKADLEGQMRGLADRLGIAVPEDRWPVLVEAARFESMKAKAAQAAPGMAASEAFWNDPTEFFHQGRSGQWTDILRTEEDRARYAARARALAPAAVVDWLHHGTL